MFTAVDGGGFRTTPALPVTAALFAWYDASVPSSLTVVDDRISQWNDLSGNSRHVASTLTNRPFIGSKINGRQTVDFQAAQYLDFAAAIGFSTATWTVAFVAVQRAEAGTSMGVVCVRNSSGNDWDNANAFLIETSDANQHLSNTFNSGGPQVAGTGPMPPGTWMVRKSTTASEHDIQSPAGRVATATSAGSGTANGGILLGGRYLSGAISASFRLNGQIGEVLLYTDRKSDSDRALIRNYLRNKWGA
jgi:hypothetical protein